MDVRAGVYARISQDRGGAGLGVERQIEDCSKVVADRGWRLAETYVDNDVSASTGRVRPSYQRLCADIESGRLDAVVVWDLDRLHRRPVELEAFIDLADRRSTQLASVSGAVNLATSDGRLHARIKGAVARQEVEHKSERQRRAMRQLAERGLWSGGVRGFGLGSDGVTLVESEAAEIRKACDAVLTGVSLGEIARGLNDRDVRTTTGRQWQATTLRQLLVQARLAGLREYHGEIIGRAAWPEIVSEDTWRAVAAILTDPSRRKGNTNVRRWLLTGLALCGVCGTPMRSATASSRNGSRRSIYRCPTTGTGERHPARMCQPVDELVSSVVIARLSQPDAVRLLADGREDAKERRSLLREAEALRVRRQQLEDDHYLHGKVTAAAFARLSAAIDKRTVEIDSRLAETGRAESLTGLAGARDVQKVWDSLPLSRRRAVVDALVEIRILPGLRGKVFDPELVEITWRQP